MSKNKKAKTKHYPSKHANAGELSQAEIWDDSALIRSWNDAVAEYEFYHSIHARGEDVEEILRKAEMDDLAEAGTTGEAVPTKTKELHHVGAPASEDGEIEDGEIDVGLEADADPDADLQAAKEALARQVVQVVQGEAPATHAKPDSAAARKDQAPPNSSSQAPPPTTSKPATIGPSLPPTGIDGPSSEQTLENIKMAYYWAGYYSGLYDGQRQAQTQAET